MQAVSAPIRTYAPAPAPARSHSARPLVDPPALATWALSFTLVTYLALRGGGFDVVVRGQVGVVVWSLVLLGALAGILPAWRGARSWTAIGLLLAFTAWTAFAIGWSESAEQSVIELARIATYLGVLVLAIAVQGRSAARHTITGVACAIGLVTVLAVLSRLHPQAFPSNQDFQFLTQSVRKLSYPLNYWNALADFAALGAPLLLATSIGARTLAGQALAAAPLPLSALCVYLTVSRGGAIALVVGIIVFLLLSPRRLEAVAILAASAAAAALLLRATAARPALTSGVPTHAAIHQGTQILWLAVIVCAAAALGRVMITLAMRRGGLPALLTPSRRATAYRGLALIGAIVVVGAALGVPSRLSHAWHDFKQPSGVVVPTSDNAIFSRLQAANGNSRYQFWQSALDANATHPWRGIGPGTFQYWWTRHATAGDVIRNAHSLYFETLAETGIIGFALLVGLLLWLVGVGIRRLLREPPALRLWLAAALAGLAVFLFSAAVEWVWQLAAFAVVALALGAVIVAGRDDAEGGARAAAGSSAAARAPLGARAALAALALAALGAVLVPLAGQMAIRDSQAAAARGQFEVALRDSVAAQHLQPYSAAAQLQQALVLEAAGELEPAASAARRATANSPTDWSAWLTLARIDARRGDTSAALSELRRARQLNPRGSVFTFR